MKQKLAEHINENLPFLKDKKLLIAISGGIDSVVLTHLLYELSFDISLAHCNFNLRELASDLDEKFIEDLGEKLELKTFTTSFDTENIAHDEKISIQLAARNLRYAWFDELMTSFHFDYLLTAHHLDDSLETFLINLSRGSGLEGFTGIPTINKNIIRPLLIFSRTEIENYAEKNNIIWREDSSNNSNKYLRNKIRHEVVPVLKEINPKLLTSFLKTTEHLQDDQWLIENTIKNLKPTLFIEESPGVFKIEISKIKALQHPKAYMYQLLKKYQFTAWNDILHLLDAQSGKRVLSETHQLLKDRDFLILSSIDPVQKKRTYSILKNTTSVENPIFIELIAVSNSEPSSKDSIYVDPEKLRYPLELRNWRKGDYFYPTGMLGKKKVSKFFKDEKYSLLEKENTWILCSLDAIIWIIGKRQDRRFLPDSHSNSLLKICAKPE